VNVVALTVFLVSAFIADTASWWNLNVILEFDAKVQWLSDHGSGGNYLNLVLGGLNRTSISRGKGTRENEAGKDC
jgi:hypothetical protein